MTHSLPPLFPQLPQVLWLLPPRMQAPKLSPRQALPPPQVLAVAAAGAAAGAAAAADAGAAAVAASGAGAAAGAAAAAAPALSFSHGRCDCRSNGHLPPPNVRASPKTKL